MRECPRCGSGNIHRSHTRNMVERFRRGLGQKRPFRCHNCEWRGWGIPKDARPAPAGRQDPEDLEKLDADLREAIDKLDSDPDIR